ncbi:MAG: monovalent cation/H(+) antiporter subunit G [Betaproteobacteria bacterium]|nr:monovalent cation/H(+) antiporter subunit G [Betaproteobacteria bacterium]
MAGGSYRACRASDCLTVLPRCRSRRRCSPRSRVAAGIRAEFHRADGRLRVDVRTLGATLGAAFVLSASSLMFSVLELRPVLHEVLIGIFMVISTPVTFVLLVRAALHRDSAEGDNPVDKNN